MKKLIPLALAGMAAFAVTGCMKGADTTADTTKIADSIKAQEAAWEKGYADKDINVLAGEYADDAALASPGEPVATTDVDRRKSLGALITDPNFKLQLCHRPGDGRIVRRSRDQPRPLHNHHDGQGDQQAGDQQRDLSDGVQEAARRRFKAVEDAIIPGPAPAAAAK